MNPSSQIQNSTSQQQLSMRVASTLAFNQFLMANGQSYPYSRLQVTRNSFFCKWIMVTGHGITGVTEYFPVLANSFPNRVLLEMIISGRAKPFPPELSQMMDHMFWWGKKEDLEWYEMVVEMMDDALDTEEEIERSKLVSILIEPKVIREIHAHGIAVDSVTEHLLLLDWYTWYVRTYEKEKCVHSPFRSIAVNSIHYIKWAIAQFNYHANAPIVVAPPDATMSAAVN
jgi:hypothetical protein